MKNMRRVRCIWWLAVALALAVVCAQESCFGQQVQRSVVAGAFYPQDPKELSMLIDTLLSRVNPLPMKGDIFAIISPHAGYQYSAEVAAYAYKLVQGKPYKTVIILAPSHHYSFKGVSVYPQGTFLTPLGAIQVDSAFARQILQIYRGSQFDLRAFEKEHAVEVQLPFLQKSIADFRIVPIVMGDCSFQTCRELATVLNILIGERRDVLVVASSDLAHRYDYQETQHLDAMTMSFLKQMDISGLYQSAQQGKVELCGIFPVVTTLLLSKARGHTTVSVLHYTNTALVTGVQQPGTWTVGYVSCAIDKEEGGMMLKPEEQRKLLEIARGSIESYLSSKKKIDIQKADPALCIESGAFVTLHKNGELRGCIGNLTAQGPLYLTVRDMAVEAALNDPRFPSVQLSEVKDIDIEISVLSPLKRVSSADEIELGVHGVLVRRGIQSGVFLPQVAQDTGWSKEEFLSYLCSHKAGLPENAWRDPSTELYVFTAEVFSEKEVFSGE